jgi:tRNA threonylcarbamoyladenosine biosynthesis protein TsaE
VSSLTLHLADAAATRGAGAAVAAHLHGGMIVAVEGDLGSGKTTLVRGVLRAVGVEGPVKSPTYTIVEHYAVSSLYFYHFDFYRFLSPDEWDSTGVAELFRDDAVCLVEWPERVAGLLPVPDLRLSLSYSPRGGRDLRAEAFTPAGARCVNALAAAPG